MAASDHLNPTQLRLFASGQQLRDEIVTNPRDWRSAHGETKEGMWERKLQQAKDPEHRAGSMYKRITRNKWSSREEPLLVAFENTGTTLMDGYHRVASAAGYEDKTGKPIWIPLTYRDFTSQE